MASPQNERAFVSVFGEALPPVKRQRERQQLAHSGHWPGSRDAFRPVGQRPRAK
jgi:hypothetical protein